MAEKLQTLPVLIRYEGAPATRTKGWHLSDLVAFCPTEPGTNSPSSMSCYSSVGQHAAAQVAYIALTRPATTEQTLAMLEHLRSIGYRSETGIVVEVIQRTRAAHHVARRAALKAADEAAAKVKP